MAGSLYTACRKFMPLSVALIQPHNTRRMILTKPGTNLRQAVTYSLNLLGQAEQAPIQYSQEVSTVLQPRMFARNPARDQRCSHR